MTAYTPPDRELPNQEAVDLVLALQRCLTSFHARHDEPAILDDPDDERLGLLSRYVEARKMRATIFGQNLFSDPSWDILLMLFQTELEGSATTLDQLSEKLRISMNIVLKHVATLERRGLVVEDEDSPAGGRRRMRPSPLATDAMSSWLSIALAARP
ncbi:biotin operon repressor [Sphingobium sp. OAS761]|uniref:ArsR family transcriptional regulator n=1 Tax=Sphingobium sp. OAS761 TaxID=2817901 RepID=UPI0020A06107|nr:ArsR family transcriptional regulator [Sphingobium sp. OAS761]MCP1468877.1 biotin operon repressor [Sphingobium sp. OAS761]